MHGGKTPKGLALPQTTTGRYSKYLPARLLDRYHEAATDSEYLALQHDIALLDARLADVLSRVDTGESGQLWRDLSDASAALDDARRASDTAAIGHAITDMQALIRRGVADYAAWGEIARIIDQRRKLVESERKRLVDMQQMVTAEQAMLFVTAVMDSVRRHVSDRSALANISADLARLADVRRSGGAGASGEADRG